MGYAGTGGSLLIFEDRVDAGRRLAAALQKYSGEDVLVLAIPRGGVVIGYEVARALKSPLDIIVPRKLGAPGQPELAIGAVIAGNEGFVLDDEMIRYLGVSRRYIEEEAERQREESERRWRMFRGDRQFPNPEGKTVILVDDGVATGYTTLAAVRVLRQWKPKHLVLAVPVAPPESAVRLRPEVDELVILETPEPFFSVGSWYNRFDQTTDDEVMELLQRSRSGLDTEGMVA